MGMWTIVEMVVNLWGMISFTVHLRHTSLKLVEFRQKIDLDATKLQIQSNQSIFSRLDSTNAFPSVL